MLTYFSLTIREEFPANHPMLSPNWTPQWHAQQPQLPLAVRLIGGSVAAVQDLVEWMTSCCQQNTIVALRSVITCPVRYILAMDAVQRLGVEILVEEIPQLLIRLRHELFDVEVAGDLFSAGNNLLPEVADAVCHCVARYFFHGSLTRVENWMHLASLNLKFDDGVKAWLAPGVLNEGPDVINAWDLWNTKSALYPAAWYRPSSSFERLRPPLNQPSSQPAQQHSSYSWVPPTAYPPPPISGPMPPLFRQSSDPGWTGNPPAAPTAPPPPPPPPKPAEYRDGYQTYPDHRSHAQRTTYTTRCNYCQEVYPDVPGAFHQCATGHAYTLSSTPSPPPRSHSQSRFRRQYSFERSPSPRRSRSQRRRSYGQSTWDASYEPPRPGEYLRERRQLGLDHFVHFFVDEYGRERTVTKGGSMSVEGPPW